MELTHTHTHSHTHTHVQQWSVELEDQEKVFLQQAQLVNTWDRMLAENGEKVCQPHHHFGITSPLHVLIHLGITSPLHLSITL